MSFSYPVIAYHMSNARREILDAQKQVFQFLGERLLQVESEQSHGEFLTEFARANASIYDALVYFDIDCIPIKSRVIDRAVRVAVNEQMLIGASQQATHVEEMKYWQSRTHLPVLWRKAGTLARKLVRRSGYDLAKYVDPFIYAAPCFLVVPTKAYLACGSPSFNSTATRDVAGQVTEAFRNSGFRVLCLSPTSCQQLKYRLGNKLAYGLGTEYGRIVFHALETTYRSNDTSASMFLKRCAQLLES